MFDNELLERFSRIHPATPFLFWGPVALASTGVAVQRFGLGLGRAAAFTAAGLFVWTFAEYILHRWVFHWTNDTAWGKRVHFLLHGVHHDFPNDRDRLVMPLPTSLPLGVIFFSTFVLSMGASGMAFFTGFVLGYLAYDGTHYAVHHFKQTTRVGKFLRKHHMLHHHADHDGGFGVSTPLWDLVFRTMPKHKRAESAASPATKAA